jgi:hypothetical protein
VLDFIEQSMLQLETKPSWDGTVVLTCSFDAVSYLLNILAAEV